MKTILTLFSFLLCWSFSFNSHAQHIHTHYCQHHKQQALQVSIAQQNSESVMAKQASNSRSDTIDIVHYDLQLDLSDISSRHLSGDCTITLVPKMDNVNRIDLDLEGYAVHGVQLNDNENVDFSRQGNQLKILLNTPISIGDTTNLKITYAGTPVPTAAFGGFYFTTNYAYNLGVGIGVDPPNYGRVWFPCFDNFVERSSYSFAIATAADQKAFCGGLLEKVETLDSGKKVWHWQLHQQIPTYLASVAVSDYTTIAFEHQGLEKTIPVEWGVRPADSNRLVQSFVHMPDAIDAFEERFGPYQFDRAGFVIVPFDGGAMEHAMNIAYPRFAVTGDLEWESLMAHEFAHHWWGNLVTTETASDMWLNEGWASYCEQVFFEQVYGKERYQQEVRNNHEEVLRLAHVFDGDFLPVSGVPFDATYSTHVYSKGSDMAHTLRGYMGEEAFFRCTKDFLAQYKFQHINSELFRDYLSECSGIHLTHFFNDWIFEAGFPHFSIDSTEVDFVGNEVIAKLFIRQRLYGGDHYYQNVPIDVTFFDLDLSTHTETIMLSDACSIHEISLPFFPILSVLDIDEKISDATTDQAITFTATGEHDFTTENVNMTINSIDAPAFVHIAHHWAMPDRLDKPIDNLILSDNRYWKIDGFNTGTFTASAEFRYDGSTSTTTGWLDNALMSRPENALTLLYRANSGNDWAIIPHTLQTGSNANDRRGSIRVDNLLFGEYVLAITDANRTDMLTTVLPPCFVTNIEEAVVETYPIAVFPNPTQNWFNIKLPQQLPTDSHIEIFDAQGKLITQLDWQATGTNEVLKVALWKSGLYFIRISNQGKQLAHKKIIITN